MNYAETSIPENYQKKLSLDFMKEKNLFLLVNLYALLVLAVLGLVLLLLTSFHIVYLSGITQTEKYWIIFFVLIGSIFFTILHEAIHGFAMKYYHKAKVKYQFHGAFASASMPGVMFYKKPYIVISLAPAVVISILLIFVMFFLDPIAFLIVYIVFAFHLSGCVGDFYMSALLKGFDESTLILDTGINMILYTKKDLEGGTDNAN